MKQTSTYLPLLAIAAGAYLLHKKSGVSGIGEINFDNGLTWAGDNLINLQTCSFDELVSAVEAKTDENAHWDARMAIAYWCAWHTDNDDDFLKYLDLAHALMFLEREREYTPNIMKARIAITQVIDNLIRRDFGKAAADRVWSAL